MCEFVCGVHISPSRSMVLPRFARLARTDSTSSSFSWSFFSKKASLSATSSLSDASCRSLLSSSRSLSALACALAWKEPEVNRSQLMSTEVNLSQLESTRVKYSQGNTSRLKLHMDWTGDWKYYHALPCCILDGNYHLYFQPMDSHFISRG